MSGLEQRELRLKRDWIGARVQAPRGLVTRTAVHPGDLVYRVAGCRGGADLVGPACPHCGVRPVVLKVPLETLVYLGHEPGDE